MEITIFYDECEQGHEAIMHKTQKNCPLCEILLLKEEIRLLRIAARLIHKRGWMVSGSLEMAECDAVCKEVGLPVWTWKDMPGEKKL
jgi:hypothetical protein